MSVSDDQFDSEVDETILGCLNLEKPRSFFLYAGAGSGKTRSLVEAIRKVCVVQGRRLSLTGQNIGVITYTNAACDEIKQRLEFDPRVEVSTIHSFAWSMIAGYNADIREWLSSRLAEDIAELEDALAKGRKGTKIAETRARSIESKRRRCAGLHNIRRFIYSPKSDNRTSDALSHAEVIAMTADFLRTKAGLRRLLVTRFPILLIDESQDTNRRLMDVLLEVESEYRNSFCIGLFGDVMQRIYADGKDRLAEAIPGYWAQPRKRMNHRCPIRVIELINRIRQDVDREEQISRSDAGAGVVRLFVVPQTTVDKTDVEAAIAARMAEITGDSSWAAGYESIKILALEHRMSARRFGFEEFFSPLYAIESIRTSFLQGTGAGIGLFTREILPLVTALRASDAFAVAAIIRRTSPLLERKALEEAGDKQAEVLKKAKEACDGLLALVSSNEMPSARSVLCYVAEHRLFTIPEDLAPFATPHEIADAGDTESVTENEASESEEDDAKTELSGWELALEAPFDQIEKYDRYVRGVSQFDTHQGVKGLEFPRVMVIVSDEEARGFLFAYDKLFGAKEKSKKDRENEAVGKETTIDRTRRLFYVTCSRTEESLAVVYYAVDSRAAQDAMVRQGWFKPDEIEIIE